MVAWAWSRACQRDRRRNCCIHWFQLRAVVPICNKQKQLLKKRSEFKICKLCLADMRKWLRRRQLLRREHQSWSRIWELKSSAFFPRFAISQCYLLMIGNNVVWRICRICTVTVTQFAQSQLQATIFCKSGSDLPRRPEPCQSSVGGNSKAHWQLNLKSPLCDDDIPLQDVNVITWWQVVEFTKFENSLSSKNDSALNWAEKVEVGIKRNLAPGGCGL